MKNNTFLSLFAFFISCLVLLTNCGQDDTMNDNNGPCESRTGNWMSAKVDGENVCTDLGTAIITEIGAPRLTVVGFYISQMEASITLDIDNPAEGTFDLPAGDNDGQYSTTDESVYFIANADGGSGTVTITEMTDSRVSGTFEFKGMEINADSGAQTGGSVEITNGEFSVALID